jgi:hypothetical protein
MVVRIKMGKNVAMSLSYNEQKIRLGKAICLEASNFSKDLEKLGFRDKLLHFHRLTSLNERSLKNAFHASLNFAPFEKLSNETLVDIANTYMGRIGFGGQPFLVYRHLDAAHPHVHIVSTNIQASGKRISLHSSGVFQSEVARKEMEELFGLEKTMTRRLSESGDMRKEQAEKINYGRAETLRAISLVLTTVLTQYNYCSLQELNIILRLYNVMADRGKENSRLYKYRGLYYRALDDKGNKVGLPIKASSIYFKPTLNYLERKFDENDRLRPQILSRLETAIRWVIAQGASSVDSLVGLLEKEKITALVSRNKEGLLSGISFVDHQSKAVVESQKLGKASLSMALKEQWESQNLIDQRSEAISKANLEADMGPDLGLKFLHKPELLRENVQSLP